MRKIQPLAKFGWVGVGGIFLKKVKKNRNRTTKANNNDLSIKGRSNEQQSLTSIFLPKRMAVHFDLLLLFSF